MDVSKEPLRIPPIHQSPRDLILALRDDDVSDRFTVLRQRRITVCRTELIFSIIGESHIVTIRQDGQVWLQEILACVDLQRPLHRFQNLEGYVYDRGDYRVSVSFLSQPPPVLNLSGIEVVFPAVWGEQPITRVQWQICEDRVQWWTLHTYPEQDSLTYVYTKSHLKGVIDG